MAHHILMHAGLTSKGWFRSAQSGIPEDAKGNPIPWYTYPAISFLSHRLNQELFVFEYGCGNSTAWFSQRVASVDSIENDEDWANEMQRRGLHNADIRFVPGTGRDYITSVALRDKLFDIIAIDGRNRVACAHFCIQFLKPDGVVVLDDAERKEYAPAFHYLFEHGFRSIDFDGFGPVVDYESRTTIFYRDANCLGI